jgi:hypothetical protein
MEDRARTVLHVCPDQQLAESRHPVLAAIGCHVVWVQNEGAALFEISLGRCGTLLLCHKLSRAARASVADYFHTNCPDPFIVAIVAHEADRHPPWAHAHVAYSANRVPLAAVLRRHLAA